MAIVLKMQAQEVHAMAGQRYVECAADDPDGQPVEEASGLDSYYGRPPWLRDATHVKLLTNAKGFESLRLSAVSAKADVDDPNRDWAAATPSGELTMTIQNPQAWGYVQPGEQYRVTVEKIRGPRDAS